MSYVDGFLLPVKKNKIVAYTKMAKLASKVWRDHGALDYKECVADDINIPGVVNFAKIAGAKKDETVVFAYIAYKSRKHRDQVMKKVMADKRMNSFDPKTMPFDCTRMACGGFKAFVEG